MTHRPNRAITLFVALVFLFLNIARPVYAGMIGANDLLRADGEAVSLSAGQIRELRQQVGEILTRYGVPEDAADRRAAMLTVSELSLLQTEIDELPAGQGALSVLGALFLVLLILELVGVTNIFNRI